MRHIRYGGRNIGGVNMPHMSQSDLRRAAQSYAKLVKAREQFRKDVVKAYESGETFTDIGKATGLSRQRIQQIITATPRD